MSGKFLEMAEKKGAIIYGIFFCQNCQNCQKLSKTAKNNEPRASDVFWKVPEGGVRFSRTRLLRFLCRTVQKKAKKQGAKREKRQGAAKKR